MPWFERAGSPTRALEAQFGAVVLQQALGNDLQPNLRLRGFDAAPLEGVPQGLAVYVDGARANEAFGDTVNWDLVPTQAIAQIEIASHHFSRLNPSLGLTWQHGATLYANYTESNRVPTAAELSCASRSQSCTLANFFVADPPLKQVVARTIELGMRGHRAAWRPAWLPAWHAVLFRSELANDIVTVASDFAGRGYFRNVGRTRREGVEAGFDWRTACSSGSIELAFLDATFRDALHLPSPGNPAAAPDGTIAVRPGARLPGMPRWRASMRLERAVAESVRVGTSLVLATAQRLRGDEAGLAAKLNGYGRLDFDASVDIDAGTVLQLLLRNALDARYATFATYTAPGAVPAPESERPLRDPRTVAPSAPRSLDCRCDFNSDRRRNLRLPSVHPA